MQAQIFHILDRHRPQIIFPVSLSEFTLAAGEPVEAEMLVTNPALVPLCFDEPNRRVIFAEMPPTFDPTQEPFLYQAQFAGAQRLLALDYDDFFTLTRDVPTSFSKLVFMHTVGRCGSTLMHHVFNKIPGAVSLSESDVFTQIHYMRTRSSADGQLDDALLVELIRGGIAFLFKASSYPDADACLIKLRNQCIDDIDLYFAAFPDAQHFFLYRSAIPWIASFHRLFAEHEAALQARPSDMLTWLSHFYGRPIEREAFGLADFDAPIGLIEGLTVFWLLMMERQREFYEQGFTMPALRYDELNVQREAALQALFQQLGLPTSAVPAALTAFAADSQAGTPLARENASQGTTVRFTDDQVARIEDVLKRQTVIRSADFLLPETILP